jgi:hypothetical protein
MLRQIVFRLLGFTGLLLLAFLAPARPTLANAPAIDPRAPQDTPDTIVFGNVTTDFTRVDTTLYWHSSGLCNAPPHGPSVPSFSDISDAISRTSTISIYPNRGIYSKDLRATNSCNAYVFSKVVADSNYLYWVDATGLVKLSKNANPGDTPAVLNAGFSDGAALLANAFSNYEIAIGTQYIYLSRSAYSVCSPLCFYNPPILFKVNKTTGVQTGLNCQFVTGCPWATNMKVDPFESYLYYIDGGTNDLQRMDLSSPTSITLLSSNVHSYFPEGYKVFCGINFCFSSDYVFIGRGPTTAGSTHEVVRYNNLTNLTPTQIYASADTTGDVSINDVVADDNEIFFIEIREDAPCSQPCFQSYTPWLFRSGRANAGSLANIWQLGQVIGLPSTGFQLDTDGVKLYWREAPGNVLRLANNATALPKTPMRIISLEVTQAVQDTLNSVPLIQGKRTFVRVYVKSDDINISIPKVTARLRATWTGGSLGGVGDWIYPTNLYAITVRPSPHRDQLNEAFLFELPFDWLNGDNLQITAELNPGHNPEQSDGYVNNMQTVGPFHLNPSPRLEVHLFDYYYVMGGQLRGPEYYEQFGNTDWIRRAYPLAESYTGMHTPGGGLHWSETKIIDPELANRVRFPILPCEDKDTKTPDPKLADCQNLRASAYVASQIAGMRSDFEAWNGDTDNTTYYGLISSGVELRGTPPMTVTYFPRGQDGGKNGAGPAGASFLGWYAGHEVGHSVGMGHPRQAALTNECGIGGDDPSPNYPHAHIGSNSDVTNVEGFLNAPSYNYPRYDNANLIAGSTTFDVMAYCLPQWISDQNYKRIYQNLTGSAPTAPEAVRSPRVVGDWLSVFGSIYTTTSTATMDYLRHTTGDVSVPARTPGAYAIRLRNLGGTTLADYAFTPSGDSDSPILLYGQVVTFAAGTRDVQIVRLSDQHVFADHPISANAPSIGSVVVVSATQPVTGNVTLQWNASDPDGLPLTFDVLYSRDGGLTYTPLQTHVPASPVQMSTLALGGGTGRFRIVASDGVNTASANSAVFVMANKAPQPVITLPGGNIHAHYGQVLNFSGTAMDPQDGLLEGQSLTWKFKGNAIGTGTTMSQSLLPPGVDVIVLEAQNSAGMTASTSVTVTVDDNIDPDGPTLQVTPGTITWHIDEGVSAPQTRTLGIVNVGTGSLAWTASSNAGWLTLSAYSGGDGASVTATGSPAGLLSGDTRTATLTFTTASAGFTQTVQIPVSLIKGNIYQATYTGPQPPGHYLLLPLIRR